jgi:hypothetical protein
VDVVIVALPFMSSVDAGPSDVAPSKKLTLPVGMPTPGATGATVAVKVTGCANPEGFVSEVRVVVVYAFTICVKGAELLLLILKFASPP